MKAIVAFVEEVTKGGSPDFVPPNERKIGTFSDALMAEAKKISWTVIGMKNDWKKIYAFEAVPLANSSRE
jgi:hypothetical protein